MDPVRNNLSTPISQASTVDLTSTNGLTGGRNNNAMRDNHLNQRVRREPFLTLRQMRQVTGLNRATTNSQQPGVLLAQAGSRFPLNYFEHLDEINETLEQLCLPNLEGLRINIDNAIQRCHDNPTRSIDLGPAPLLDQNRRTRIAQRTWIADMSIEELSDMKARVETVINSRHSQTRPHTTLQNRIRRGTERLPLSEIRNFINNS